MPTLTSFAEMSSKTAPTGKQIVAARGLLEMTQPQLAEASGVGLTTIVDFETSKRLPRRATLAALQEALERRGIEFLNGGEPGVRLKPSKALIPT
jgi:transcriptional regulator with XRE-family HTH domain